MYLLLSLGPLPRREDELYTGVWGQASAFFAPGDEASVQAAGVAMGVGAGGGVAVLALSP